MDHNECQLDKLKQCMSANFKMERLQTFALKLAVDDGMKIRHPSLSILAEIILTYPASTAQVERGFSIQNAIKNKCRNRLGSVHLNQLICMRLNAPSIEDFPFHQAYVNWLDKKKRRYVVSKPSDSDDSDQYQ